MHVLSANRHGACCHANHLEKIAATPAKGKEMSAERIMLKYFLYLQLQAG